MTRRAPWFRKTLGGSIPDAAQVWAVNELEPEQARLLQINDWLGEEVVSFRPYEIPAP
ncbi:hypothetical protein EMIT0196MI5_90154 [Pseudomonas sp. IT-196MI5]